MITEFYELRYFMICSCYGKVTSLNGEAEPGIVLEAVSRSSAGCENLQEESKTEQDGSFRIRGLQVRKGSFILERKRKRRRFQPVALFPICVFILQRQQQRQRSKEKIAFAFALV